VETKELLDLGIAGVSLYLFYKLLTKQHADHREDREKDRQESRADHASESEKWRQRVSSIDDRHNEVVEALVQAIRESKQVDALTDVETMHLRKRKRN